MTQNFSSQPSQPTSIGMRSCNLTRGLLTICSEKEFYLVFLNCAWDYTVVEKIKHTHIHITEKTKQINSTDF